MAKTGYTCIRKFLFLLNLIFWLSGACLLIFGVWLNVSFDGYSAIMNLYDIINPGNVLILCGLLTFFISLCGLCGAHFQNKFLLGFYLTFIIIIMVMEIVAGAIGFFVRENIRNTLKSELTNGIREKYALNSTNGLAPFWDILQVRFDCCGVDNHTDWFYIKAWANEKNIPSSCCSVSEVTYSYYLCPDGESLRKEGCFINLQKWILEHLFVVAIACVIFSFIQFFAIASSLLMICTMDFKKYCPVHKSSYDRVANA